MIIESGHAGNSVSNSNLFANSRLASIPYGGVVSVELQANGGSVTATLQLPNGDVPFDGIEIPNGVTERGLTSFEKFAFTFAAQQGSAPSLEVSTGTGSTLEWRISLSP